MLFMSEGLFVYFLCYLWVKVACLLFNAFWAYKNIWMKVACLHFVLFMLFLCVKSFCKKRSEIIPNDLIYITTLLSQSFSIITMFFYYHNNFPLSQYFSIITIIFHHHNNFPSSQSFSIIIIFFHYHNFSLWSQSMIMTFCQFHKFLFYAF